jgi:hypothetical protein
MMELLAQDAQLSPLVLELIWRSNDMNERIALLITRLLEAKVNNPTQLRMFRYSMVVRAVPPSIIVQWIEHILADSSPDSASVALDLFEAFYLREDQSESIPKELSFSLLIHPYFCAASQENRRNQMEEYYWTRAANAFMRSYPQRALDLAEVMLENFGELGAVFNGFRSTAHQVLNDIAQQRPKEIWRLITRYISLPDDSRTFRIMDWLPWGIFSFEDGDQPGELPHIPIEELWRWIDEDIADRAWYVARFVPKGWVKTPGFLNLAREILIRYGTREDVRSSLMSHFSSGDIIVGNISEYYVKRREEVLSYKDGESNANVLRWINEFIDELDRIIEIHRIGEERRR